MKFLITLEQGEDGYITAECPALPGCVTQGKTRDEVLKNIKEAIELSIETRKELGYHEFLEVAELDIAL